MFIYNKGGAPMFVTRSKGMTVAIRIFSIFVISVFILLVISSINYLINSNNYIEMIQGIFALLLFLLILIVNLLLTIKAYKRNPTVLKTDGDKLIIFLGYRTVNISISSIEKLGYSEYRGFTAINIKLKGKRIKRYTHFCKSDELDTFMSRLKTMNRKIKVDY